MYAKTMFHRPLPDYNFKKYQKNGWISKNCPFFLHEKTQKAKKFCFFLVDKHNPLQYAKSDDYF